MALAKFGEWYEDEAMSSGTNIAVLVFPVSVTGRPEDWHGVEAWFDVVDGRVKNVLPKIVRGFRHPRKWATEDMNRLPVELEKQVMKALGGWVGLKKMITGWIFSYEIEENP